MAGIPAGTAATLNINIVAEVARLQQDMDRIKKLVKNASGEIAASAQHANDNLASVGAGIGKAGNQSKLAAHHVQNLAFQFQDMAVGLYSGQKPLTVFLQQGSQIAGVMAQAGIGVGGLVRNVLGMVAGFARAHPILLLIGAAAGVVTGAFALMADEINKTSEVQVTATDVMLGTFDVLRDAITGTVISAFQAMGIDIGKVWENVKAFTKSAINFVIGAIVAVPKFIADTWRLIPPAFGDAFYSAANLAIEAINFLIDKSSAALNWFIDGFNATFGTSISNVVFGGLSTLGNKFAGSMAALGSAGARSLSESFGRDYLGSFANAVSGAAQNRALQKAAEDAAEKVGGKAGKAGGKAAGKAMADEMAMSFAEAFKDFQLPPGIEKIWDRTAQIQEQIDAINREAKAVGLEGWQRERLLLILEASAKVKRLQAERDAEDSADRAKALDGEIAKTIELLRLQLKMGNTADGIAKEAAEVEGLNDALRETVDLLRDIGGLGGVLGNLLGFLTGDFDGMSGPLGYLLKTQVKGRDGELRKLGDLLKASLGSLGDTLTTAIKSAGLGMAAGTAIFGKQGTVGQLGSAIGGALGGKLGEKFLGSALGKLGDFAGPIGSIVGGILGSVVGKLFSGTPRGSAIISGGKVSGFYGGNKEYEQQAGQIANGLLDTMQQIASQFGTTLNAQAMGSLSIGVRDGRYAVDTLGRGYTKSSIQGVKSFGTDAEAAVQYALKLMLERGAITMREGSMKIIKAATDLEDGLTKALKFEEIMNLLDGSGSPLVSAVKAARAQFEEYISVMKEAGAATEDLARVQQMQADQIKAIIAQAGDSYRSQFYTDEQSLAFAQQQIKAALDPLGKGWIDTVAEYMAAVEAAQLDTSDAGLAYLGTLYELADQFAVLKDAADAAAAQAAADRAQREADRAAAAAERQRQIDAAKDALRQAYDREADGIRQTIDRFNAFADSLADFRKELFAGEEGAKSYAQRLAELRRVGGLAGMGNEDALAALPGVGRDFLSASRNRAGSLIEYQRDVAMVARYAGTAEQAARGMVSEAQKQLDLLDKQVGKLISINDNVISVEQAIRDLIKLQGGGSSGGGSSTRPTISLPSWLTDNDRGFGFGGLFGRHRDEPMWAPAAANDTRTAEAVERLESRMQAQEENGRRTADSMFAMNKLWQGMTRDGNSLVIATDDDTPISTVAA